jgi:hypothetical protein
MDTTEQGYGLQPCGSERCEARNNKIELFHAVAVVSPPDVPPGGAPAAPSTPAAPVQAAAAIIVPNPCFMDNIGNLESNVKSLDELVKLITNFTTPAGVRAMLVLKMPPINSTQ